MRRIRFVFVTVVAIFALGAPAAMGQSFDIDYGAQLKGTHEVPPVETAGSGRAVFDVRDAGNNGVVAYRLFLRNIDEVTAAHIHVGCPGENGPIIVTLFSGGPTGTVNGVLVRGLITRDDLEGPLEGRGIRSLIRAMNSGCTYVNVHTLDHPGGEIRGQIQQVSDVP